ncbi:hypothetical protein HanPSC8_Chr08g0338981 [Helianthus annuus]|nr:hypothetical protein HanPSC8_Chr08g0338981 [Helianthus annuus]
MDKNYNANKLSPFRPKRKTPQSTSRFSKPRVLKPVLLTLKTPKCLVSENYFSD